MSCRTIRHVLVVDDEPDIRTFLSMNLEMSDYQVVVAEDGLEAERLIRKLTPHLIILDVMMPGVDGIAVLRSIREDPLTADIPVIVISAMIRDEDVWAGWEAGASYYLTKPFDIDHLLNFVESLENQTLAPEPSLATA